MSDATSEPNDNRRCGFVAALGPTNAGKSTLINALVGVKVSIVSHKAQTTRAPIRGIALEGESQIVFIDTAGVFDPKRRLDRAMIESAWTGAGEADIVMLVIDAARGVDDAAAGIIERLKNSRSSRIVVLNKVDHIDDKERLLGLTKHIDGLFTFDRLFMVSALKGVGVDDLRTYLANHVPKGPWHYAEDDVTDAPVRMMAAEATRERIYHWLHDELPYAITVETTSWKAFKDGSARVEQTIFVERDSQKSIVLGKGGATIKKISTEARQAIAEIAGHPIHLFLFVKVRENWGGDPERYREMGLNFPKS